MSYITTVTGKHFDPVEPQENLIDIRDIAHSLSMQCRANGHTRIFYSVAQHSLACAMEALERGYSKEIVLGCLLHDGSEAYLSDVTRPVKKELPYYLEVEDHLQNMIWRHFIGRDLTEAERETVFGIDDQMLAMEFRELMPEEFNSSYTGLVREVRCEYKEPSKVEEEFISFFESAAAAKIAQNAAKSDVSDTMRLMDLMDRLIAAHREGEMQRAMADSEYRQKLFCEFGL